MSLINTKNYYVYVDMVNTCLHKVYVPKDITKENILDHIDAIQALLLDGVDEPFIEKARIELTWDNVSCRLNLPDYWFNLFMWYSLIELDTAIRPYHILFGDNLRRKNIKNWFDKFILNKENKQKYGSRTVSGIMADAMDNYRRIEKFALYLCNTINTEDDIALMKVSQDYYDALHFDNSGIPIENVNAEGQKAADKAIEIIKNSRALLGYDHGLKASFEAMEAINPRQFRESFINVGAKPDGQGGVFSTPINSSYKNGGVNTPMSFFEDAQTARTAQKLSKKNVGSSGYLARKLKLNNTDTKFRKITIGCRSCNLIKYEIKTEKHLSMIRNRWFKYTNSPSAADHVIDEYDLSMVGKTVYLHSPMTCSTHANGSGICSVCYGEDLYYTNIDINPGVFAAENLSSKLTQILLSAKHLLEASVKSLAWNESFMMYTSIDGDTIYLDEEFYNQIQNPKAFSIVIDMDSIELVSDEEDSISYDDGDISSSGPDYNEYITSFIIRTPNEDFECCSAERDPLYLTTEFSEIIKKRSSVNNSQCVIPLSAIGSDCPLFFINITNNEISQTMNDIINTIDKVSTIQGLSKDELLQLLVDRIIKGKLDVDSVHLEVILSNQIVNPENILERPNWDIPNVPYHIFTLNQALTNNPSPVVSIMYKDISRALSNPLTFDKHKPSFFDVYLQEQPQNNSRTNLRDDSPVDLTEDKFIEVCRMIDPNEE